MIDNRESNYESKKQQGKAPFSFMKLVADFVTTLTSDEIQEGTRSDGMVYFKKENGSPKILHPKNTEKSENSVWLRANTVGKRSGVFEPSGQLAHLKSFVYANGKMDRKFLIEEITCGDPKNRNSEDLSKQKITSRSISTGSILARAKNAFRESDSVEQIIKLYTWDLLYVTFVDESHVYSISVKDSSRMVGNSAIALCNITYREGAKEITQEWIIRLPIHRNGDMFVTTGGKKIMALNKKIANIKLRRRKEQSTH